MKPLTVVTLSVSLFLFAACKKSTTTPVSNSSDQSITFSASGNPVVVTKISVDTSRDIGFEYPLIIVKGIASIASTKDTLTFELQFFNSDNSLVSVSKFMGLWDDTTQIHHGSNLTLSSVINNNAYQDAGNGFNDFAATITANDGKTITGTFSGSLVTFINNTGAQPTLPIANGAFKIDLPGK